MHSNLAPLNHVWYGTPKTHPLESVQTCPALNNFVAIPPFPKYIGFKIPDIQDPEKNFLNPAPWIQDSKFKIQSLENFLNLMG